MTPLLDPFEAKALRDALKEAQLRAICERRGLTVQYLRPEGRAVRVFGAGVDILADKLARIATYDLNPVHCGR